MEDTLVKFGDLAYYDGKIKDYIGDVTAKNPIKVTHAELVSLRDDKELVPGQWYQITDFYTTTSQPHTRSIGCRSDILTMAVTPNKFAKTSYLTEHDFNVDPETHLSSEINPFTGLAYSQRDDEANTMTVDGVWELPCSIEQAIGCPVTYHLDAKYYLERTDERGGRMWPYYWYGTEKFIWTTDGTRKKRWQYVGTQVIDGSTYHEWSAYNQVFTLSDTPAAGDTLYDVTGTALADTLMSYIELEPKGIITEMCDVWDNKCGYDFHSIQFERDEDAIAICGIMWEDNNTRNLYTNTYDGYYYTFNGWYEGILFDMSHFTMQYGGSSHAKYNLAMRNEIPAYYNTSGSSGSNPYGGFYNLPNNTMFSTMNYSGTDYSFPSEFRSIHDNKFSHSTHDNTLGYVRRNTITGMFYNVCTWTLCHNIIHSMRDVYCKYIGANEIRCYNCYTISGGAINNNIIKGYGMMRVNLGTYPVTNTETARSLAYSHVERLYDVSIGTAIAYCELSGVAHIDFGSDLTSIQNKKIWCVMGTSDSHKAIPVTVDSSTAPEFIGPNSDGDIVACNPFDLATPMSPAQVASVLNQV